MQRSLLFIEQNSIDIRVIRVTRANINSCQAGAVTEGPIFDAGNAITNRDARQSAAFVEGPILDAGDTIRNRDARQVGAVSEGQNPDAGDRIAFNGIGDHQFPRGYFITIGDGDLAAGRGVSQVS